jgi:hypothetical protein
MKTTKAALKKRTKSSVHKSESSVINEGEFKHIPIEKIELSPHSTIASIILKQS